MRLTKKLQYGFMASLYLSTVDQAKISDISNYLDIGEDFMQQIIRDMRVAGLVKVKKGPGGGVSIKEGVLVGDVFKALQPIKILTPKEFVESRNSDKFEERAVLTLAVSMQYVLSGLLNKTVHAAAFDLKQNEMDLGLAIAEDPQYN